MHKLIIKSLHDAQAECPCGWHYIYTGERTKQEIEHEYAKHLPKRKKESKKESKKMKNTYWGPCQSIEVLETGAVWVSTASHGGLMLTKTYAEKHLSEAARRRGARFGSYYAYEEDCAYAIAIWELPHLHKEFFKYHDANENHKDLLLKILSAWYADFLLEIGVEPEPIGYKSYLERQEDARMRKEKHPDLIVAARGTWFTKLPGVIEVTTADNKEHLITEESYRREGLNLLSKCTLHKGE